MSSSQTGFYFSNSWKVNKKPFNHRIKYPIFNKELSISNKKVTSNKTLDFSNLAIEQFNNRTLKILTTDYQIKKIKK